MTSKPDTTVDELREHVIDWIDDHKHDKDSPSLLYKDIEHIVDEYLLDNIAALIQKALNEQLDELEKKKDTVVVSYKSLATPFEAIPLSALNKQREGLK